MHNLSPIAQSLFLNKQIEPLQKQLRQPSEVVVIDPDQQQAQSKTVDAQYSKIGDDVGVAQAQELFEHTNRYAAMPSKVQYGLEAYTAIEVANKREAIRSLMGVDLYA